MNIFIKRISSCQTIDNWSKLIQEPHLITARTSQNAHGPAASHPNFRPVFSAPTSLCPSRTQPTAPLSHSQSHCSQRHCAHGLQEYQSGESHCSQEHSSGTCCDKPFAQESQALEQRGLVLRRMLRDGRWSLSGCEYGERSVQYLLVFEAGDGPGLRRCRRASLVSHLLRSAEREAMCCL